MSFIECSRDNYWMLSFLDKYMSNHHGFICGGCFKNIFNKEKIKDIDIFFESKSDYDSAVEYFDEQSKDEDSELHYYYENKNVKAYKDKKSGLSVELCSRIFGTPEQILNQFDFTITKFSYFKAEVEDEPNKNGVSNGTHIEYKILMHPQFFEHLHTHRLVIDDAVPYPMSTLERMFRYARYGFAPCRETKIKIAKAIHDLPSEKIEVSEVLYDGMD